MVDFTCLVRRSRYYYSILPTIKHTVIDAHHVVSTILTVIPAPLTNETADYNKSVMKRHVPYSLYTQSRHTKLMV